MSVINQMLRDLDTRQANEQERAGLPQRLRTLPPLASRRPHSWRTLAIGIGVGALVAGILTSILLAPAPIAPPQTAHLPATPPAPLGNPPPAVPGNSGSAVPPAPTAVAPAGKVPPPSDLAEMKFSLLLRQAAQPPESSTPQQTASKAVPAAAKAAPAAAKPATAVVTPEAGKPMPAKTVPSGDALATEGQIDKRAKDGQAREMAEGEYRKGMQAVKRGDNAAALVPLQRALELDPTLAKARQALLSVLVSGKQWAAAQQVAEQGLAIDPAQSGWAMILARLQFEQGDTAAAAETLGRHAAHASNDADYQGLHAYLLQKMQRPVEAAQRFQAALNLRPQEGRWWFGLGLALESAGRGAEAKEAYAKAREIGHLPPDMATVVEQKLK